MPLQVLNGPNIAAGESLSDGLDCRAGSIIRLTMPPEWTTGANITFQISTDGTFYNDLVNIKGEEVTLPVRPGSAVVLAQFAEQLKAIAFLKIRSGTPDHPVAQDDDRAFAVAIEVEAGGVVTAAGKRK